MKSRIQMGALPGTRMWCVHVFECVHVYARYSGGAHRSTKASDGVVGLVSMALEGIGQLPRATPPAMCWMGRVVIALRGNTSGCCSAEPRGQGLWV